MNLVMRYNTRREGTIRTIDSKESLEDYAYPLRGVRDSFDEFRTQVLESMAQNTISVNPIHLRAPITNEMLADSILLSNNNIDHLQQPNFATREDVEDIQNVLREMLTRLARIEGRMGVN